MQPVSPDVDRALLDLVDSFRTMGAYLAPDQEPPMRVAMHALATAIVAYGDMRAAQEQERIKAAALAIRADYPEEVFATLPAAAGARLAIDRLLAVL